MRWVWGACALAVGTLAFAGASVREASGGRQVTAVSVDLKATRQTIQGFGSTERIWTDPHLARAANPQVPASAQAAILTAIYGRLGLTRVRALLDPGIQSSKGGPFNFSGKLTDAQVPFIEQAKRYGLKTFFPAPLYLEDWMQADDPTSYVDYAMAIIQRWRQDGLEPPYYSPMNEPEVTHDFPPQWLHDVVLQLGQRLRAAGFKTKLVIPDDENPIDAYRRAVAVLSDPAARQYVGAIAFHIYRIGGPSDWPALRALATKYRLPLWMTEWTGGYKDWADSLDWGVKMHELLTIGSVNAVDYLYAFFGNWVGNDMLVRIDFDHNGVYQDFAYTSLYWITGQYSRFVRPGYVRVAATPSQGVLLPSAYVGDGRVVTVVINPGTNPEPLRVAISGGRVGPTAQVVRSSASETWKQLAPLTLKKGAFSTVMPPMSIATFIVRRVK